MKNKNIFILCIISALLVTAVLVALSMSRNRFTSKTTIVTSDFYPSQTDLNSWTKDMLMVDSVAIKNENNSDVADLWLEYPMQPKKSFTFTSPKITRYPMYKSDLETFHKDGAQIPFEMNGYDSFLILYKLSFLLQDELKDCKGYSKNNESVFFTLHLSYGDNLMNDFVSFECETISGNNDLVSLKKGKIKLSHDDKISLSVLTTNLNNSAESHLKTILKNKK